MTDKIVVKKRAERLDIKYVSVDVAIKELQRIAKTYGQDAMIEPDDESYDDDGLAVYFKRLETDKEYQNRMDFIERIEKRDRETYERLKARFEG